MKKKIELSRFAAEARQKVRVIEQAITATEALEWFETYGSNLKSTGTEGASVKVHLNYASSTAWVERGKAYLDRAAQSMLADIVSKAIEMANADYEAALSATPDHTAERGEL